MAIQKTEAFVLKTSPFRTSSLIVTTFSRRFGKVKGIVKGVRREGFISTSAFEPFSLIEMVFYEKIHSELHLISEVSILDSFEKLRTDLEVLATAYSLIEWVDSLTEPHDPHESVFELLHLIFNLLPSFPPSLLARLFEVRILHEIGLLPHLESCMGCGKDRPEKACFSIKQGGIFCLACRQRSPEARTLSKDTLEAMRFFIEKDTSEAVHFSLGEKVEREMSGVVEKFLVERIGKELRTRRFLAQVRGVRRHRPSLHKSIGLPNIRLPR